MLVFVPRLERGRLDEEMVSQGQGSQADMMLSERCLGILRGLGDFGELWRRDWTEFGNIFQEEQRLAWARLEKDL